MPRYNKRKLKIGYVIRCQDADDMAMLINHFASKGIDAKPNGNYYDVEIVDIERRKKR